MANTLKFLKRTKHEPNLNISVSMSSFLLAIIVQIYKPNGMLFQLLGKEETSNYVSFMSFFVKRINIQLT